MLVLNKALEGCFKPLHGHQKRGSEGLGNLDRAALRLVAGSIFIKAPITTSAWINLFAAW